MIKNFITDSNRSVDVNGYLTIKDCILTETGVAEYLGREIPDWQTFGLESEEVYTVYRPLEILEDNVNTFNNVPVTMEHPESLDAESFKDVKTYGATGESSRIEDGKLLNNIIIYDADMIKHIEASSETFLSCGYFWNVVKSDNKDYDFVITDITGNHVAVVETPRIETAKIADSKYRKNNKIGALMKKWFSKDSSLELDSLEEFQAELANLLSKYELEDKFEVVEKVGDEEAEDSEEESKDNESEDSEEESKDNEETKDNESEDSEEAKDTYTKDEVDKMIDELKKELMFEEADKEEAMDEAEEILGDVSVKAGDALSIRKMILDAKGISHKGMNKSAIKGAVKALRTIAKPSPRKAVGDSTVSAFSKDLIKKIKGDR